MASLPRSIFCSTSESLSYVVHLIIPSVTLPLILGVFIGGPMGVSLSKKMSDKTVSVIYGVFLLLFIGKKAIELLL